ncbi:MAG: tRNA (guanine(10)-N(2))-dimethyltransferase [Candidatus Hermodarchaeota archaeon]
MNYDLTTIQEGSLKFLINTADKNSIPSKSMAVFYNKKMEINRDITNLAINAYNKIINQGPLTIVDSMAASGISSIRILKECNNVEKIFINDINPHAVDLIHKNLSLNGLNNQSAIIEVSRKDSNYLFSEIAQNALNSSEDDLQKPNIISIDPFGTPNLYLDAAFKAIKRINGLLCITATDTAVLFGVRPLSCIRKYMSKPLHTEYCKEIGARILVYFISRIANMNNMGIIPLLTFYTSHFIRVYCLTFKNRKKITHFFKEYRYFFHCNNCGFRSVLKDENLKMPIGCPFCKKETNIDYAGPIWNGELHDANFINEMIELNKQFNYNNKNRIHKLLHLIKGEIEKPPFYYNIHKLSKVLKISNTPKLEEIIKLIKEKGYKISRTHFDFLSIKTNMDIISIKDILLQLGKK